MDKGRLGYVRSAYILQGQTTGRKITKCFCDRLRSLSIYISRTASRLSVILSCLTFFGMKFQIRWTGIDVSRLTFALLVHLQRKNRYSHSSMYDEKNCCLILNIIWTLHRKVLIMSYIFLYKQFLFLWIHSTLNDRIITFYVIESDNID